MDETVQSLLVFAVLGLLFKLFISCVKKEPSNQFINIPEVSGAFPFLGHALPLLLTQGPSKFLKECGKRYGSIFRIRVFGRTYAFVCGKDELEELFKCSEEQLSLYHIVYHLCFMDSFFPKELLLSKTFGVFKQGIKTNPDIFLPQIEEEVKTLVQKLKGEQVLTPEHLRRFTMGAVTSSYLGLHLSELMLSEVEAVMEQFRLINSLSSIVPRVVLLHYAKWKVLPLCKNFTRVLNEQVDVYRKDETLNQSKLLRIWATYKHPDIGRILSPIEIAGLALLILYSATANTPIALFNVLADLAFYPEYLRKVKEETDPFIKQGDLKGLVTAPVISSCVNETLRLTTGFFAITRIPKRQKNLGKWDLTGIDGLSVCVPVLHLEEAGTYQNAEKYWPERYDAIGEPSMPPFFLSWGAGIHMCPARLFAGYAIKMATATLFKEFKITLDSEKLQNGSQIELDYLVASFFAKRKCILKIEPNK